MRIVVAALAFLFISSVCCNDLVQAVDSRSLLEVGKFSAAQSGKALPEGWKSLTFKKVPKHTMYEIVKDGADTVIRASSDDSASGLIKEVTIDPKEYPVVRWRWKIDHLLVHSDVSRKEGDDYPARLYITFAYDPDKVGLAKRFKYKAGRVLFGEIPIAALNYIWDTKAPLGSIVDNAYTDFAKMIVVESGHEHVGGWVYEERDVLEDYRKAFGDDPPMINGVAIMTDTDNTKEQAVAYYGDIQFVRASR